MSWKQFWELAHNFVALNQSIKQQAAQVIACTSILLAFCSLKWLGNHGTFMPFWGKTGIWVHAPNPPIFITRFKNCPHSSGYHLESGYATSLIPKSLESFQYQTNASMIACLLLTIKHDQLSIVFYPHFCNGATQRGSVRKLLRMRGILALVTFLFPHSNLSQINTDQ